MKSLLKVPYSIVRPGLSLCMCALLLVGVTSPAAEDYFPTPRAHPQSPLELKPRFPAVKTPDGGCTVGLLGFGCVALLGIHRITRSKKI
jgi:hypothetical protein